MERKKKVIQMSPALQQVLEEWVRKTYLASRRMSDPAPDWSTFRTITSRDIARQLAHTVARILDPRTLANIVSEQPMALSLLQAFTKHPDYMVRWSVVHNPVVSASILATLAGDPVEFIRREVARHVLTPPEVLHQLSPDTVLSVRYAVATNPNTEWNTLEQMVNSKSQRIVRAIANHLNTPADHPVKQQNKM